MPMPAPIQVTVGGATVFLPVKNMNSSDPDRWAVPSLLGEGRPKTRSSRTTYPLTEGLRRPVPSHAHTLRRISVAAPCWSGWRMLGGSPYP
jgi:hypothetical protein